jgi:hypothetical protein
MLNLKTLTVSLLPRELIVLIRMANRPRRRSFTIKPPHRAREQPLPVGTVAVARYVEVDSIP